MVTRGTLLHCGVCEPGATGDHKSIEQAASTAIVFARGRDNVYPLRRFFHGHPEILANTGFSVPSRRTLHNWRDVLHRLCGNCRSVDRPLDGAPHTLLQNIRLAVARGEWHTHLRCGVKLPCTQSWSKTQRSTLSREEAAQRG